MESAGVDVEIQGRQFIVSNVIVKIHNIKHKDEDDHSKKKFITQGIQTQV